MPITYRKFIWLALAIFATLFALALLSDSPQPAFIIVPIILVWLVALVRMSPFAAKPLTWIQQHPALLWLVWILSFFVTIGAWTIVFQPAAGIDLSATEIFYGLTMLYGLLFFYSTRLPRDKNIGWMAGPLITLTTILIIIFALEFALRFVWIRSDNFQFSKIHQTWARLYWNPINDYGYRDYEPDFDAAQHIIVAGDSLASGYGVNSIDDTFPQQLQALVGDKYNVNLVAQPGWGISTALAAVEDYPITPDILILSHYINDIGEGPAGSWYQQNNPFPEIRLEPDESQRWWVDNTYIGNFLFYRVFLYTQHDSTALYNDWVHEAYQLPHIWQAYMDEMQGVIDWSSDHDTQLIVVVWPNLLNIANSRQYTQPVVDYFIAQGITVVDMADYLEGTPANELIANTFDAHPNSYSHNIAAQQLFAILTGD